ncbi:Uncharacterised protein [Streptococcus pneumoniae]|nr:Uncharacterised protein [Streptococcus pneumoniae]
MLHNIQMKQKINIVHMLMLKFGYSSCIIGLFLGLGVILVNFYQWNGEDLYLLH